MFLVSKPYSGVSIQQAPGDDGIQEHLVRGNDVVQVLGLLHFVPKLIPRTFKHLGNNKGKLRDTVKLFPGL